MFHTDIHPHPQRTQEKEFCGSSHDGLFFLRSLQAEMSMAVLLLPLRRSRRVSGCIFGKCSFIFIEKTYDD
jgi:hypothetical protein